MIASRQEATLDPPRSNLGDPSDDIPGETVTAASGGTDTISSVAAADSVAAEAFEVWSQIGTVPPRI
jgi:hypothetical protein